MKFITLQQRTLSELSTNSTITPEILIESLTWLSVALRSEYQSFIAANLQTLKKADSIRKIFHYLNPHFTFIDYQLLAHVIDYFGSEELKMDMSKYIDSVQEFVDQTTVQELMDHWPGVGEIPPHFEELRAVIEKDPSLYTLRQLDDLQKRLCNKIMVSTSESLLILVGIRKRSSFLLSWITPTIYLPRLKSVIKKLSSFFQVERVYSLTHDGQRLYSMAVGTRCYLNSFSKQY